MILRVNGEAMHLPEGASLSDLLRRLGVEAERGVAIALEGEVVPRGSWPGTALGEGQRVEVVRAVQGG